MDELLRLLEVFAAYPLVQTQFSDCIAWIFSFEDRSLESFSSLTSFINQRLGSSRPEEITSVLILLRALAECTPHRFSHPDIQRICFTIDRIFKAVRREHLITHYTAALSCLAVFIRCLIGGQSTALCELLDYQLRILSDLVQNKKLFSMGEKEFNIIIIQTFENVEEAIEEGRDLEAAAPLLLEFIASQCGIMFPWTLGAKVAMLDLAGASITSYSRCADPRRETICARLIICLAEALKDDARLDEGNEIKAADFYREEKLPNAAFIFVNKLCATYRLRAMRQLVAELRESLKPFPTLILKLVGATAESLQSVYLKELKTLVEDCLFPGLNSSDVVLAATALRTACFLVEFIGEAMQVYYSQLLSRCLAFLDLRQTIPLGVPSSNDNVVLLSENALFLLEIIVENCDEKLVESISERLLRSVLEVFLCEGLDFLTRRSALSTLATSFAATPASILERAFNHLASVIQLAINNEQLSSEAFTALGALCLYTLRGREDAHILFSSVCGNPLGSAIEAVSKRPIGYPQTIEGAIAFLYYSVQLFERHAHNFVTPRLFSLAIELASEECVSQNASESQISDSSNCDNSESLAYSYMRASALHLIGDCLRYLPDRICPPSHTSTCLMSALSRPYENERKQAFSAITKWLIGDFRYSKVTHIDLLLQSIPLIFEDEPSILIVHLEELDSLIMNLCDTGKKTELDDPLFYSTLLRATTNFLDGLKGREVSAELLGSLAELLNTLSRQRHSDTLTLFLTSAFSGLLRVAFDREEKEEAILEELYGLGGDLIGGDNNFLLVLATRHPHELQKMLDTLPAIEEDECARNAAFFLGSLFSRMSPPMFSAAETLRILFDALQKLYTSANSDFTRDNCVSAAVKLYLNETYTSITESFLPDSRILLAIESAVPLRGDKEESVFFVYGLAQLCRKGHAESVLASNKILLFLTETVARHSFSSAEEKGAIAAINLLQGFKKSLQFQTFLQTLDPTSQKIIVDALFQS